MYKIFALNLSNKIIRYLFGLSLFVSSTLVFATDCKDAIQVGSTMKGVNIPIHALHYEDKTGILTIQDILSDPNKTKFLSLEKQHANFGIAASAHWLRLALCTDSEPLAEYYIELLSSLFDNFELYITHNNTVLKTLSANTNSTFAMRDINNRRLLLPVNLNPDSRNVLYFRMSSENGNLIDMTMRLWSPREFVGHNQTLNTIWGMFYGGMLLIIFYNMFIYFTIRDPAYLYYVFYQISMVLAWASTSGHGFTYLWQESLFMKTHGPIIIAGLTAILSAQFSRHFLRTQAAADLNDKILIMAGAMGLLLIISILLNFRTLANILIWNVSLVPLAYLFIGVRRYRKGFQPARFYLIAWVFIFIGTAVFGLLGTGIIHFSSLAEIAGPTGVCLEASFLSFALADRIKILQQEKIETQSRLIQAQIEPHFLFNTLANISSLIETNVARARLMLDQLDTYLRTTLDRTRKQKTTLGQEVELLKAYLSIIQIRMGNRLQYHIDISDKFSTFIFPPLLLQPLVENSIKHGLEPKPEGGEITITGKLDADKLILEVRDTGVGLTENWLAGTGLSNVYERIKILFGNHAKLTIMEQAGGGVTSRLELPITK